jgi:hypothetical protein
VPDDRRRRLTLLGLAAITVIALGVSLLLDGRDDPPARASRDRGEQADGPDGEDEGDGEDTGLDPAEPEGEYFRTEFAGFADPEGFLQPYPNADLEGLLTFRGNPSRTYHGKGPVPRALPAVLHRFPDEPMCRSSVNLGTTKVWCGMGWTGQPLIAEREEVRRPHPLHGRHHRRADPPRRRHRRHHQGHAHHGP